MEDFSSKLHNSLMKSGRKIHPMDPKLVARRIEAVRIEAQMTKKDFASVIGVDPSTYTKISNGKMPLTAEKAYALAEMFSVPMDYIYRNDLSKIPDNRSKALIAILNGL